MRTVVMRVPPDAPHRGMADERILRMLLQNANVMMSGGGDAVGGGVDHQMSYEELLERFGVGTEHRRGASADTIRSLPLTELRDQHDDVETLPDHQRTCHICLEDFVVGDRMRHMVDCSHVFHRSCIDRWLEQVSSCPVCKTEVRAPDSTAASASAPSAESSSSSSSPA